ncbi:unnamed protein product [Echinostoma caproni]|uniref:Uncharacterized protein n=1 Tax=Echinostoma caproni TaxID=27848 RepID=A0A3P8KRX7_9TREM|nr:unnamed protein product [Echinostoma caproni]
MSESLQLAHQAVRFKPTDGRAWSVLGNALLTAFFESWGSVAAPPNTTSLSTTKSESAEGAGASPRGGQLTSSQLIMTRCIAAYAQAAKDRIVALEPNFHYNRGVAWHFQDSFTNALCSWLRAICLDPQWPAPRACATRLIEFLLELQYSIEQVRREMSVAYTETNRMEAGVKTPCGRRDPHRRVVDLITPLVPCLNLTTTSDLGKEEDSKVTSPTGTQSISRLLGPYAAAAGDTTRALLSGIQQTGRSKRARGAGKRTPAFTSPFQNVTSWQLTLCKMLPHNWVGPAPNLSLTGEVIEQVDKVCYLSSYISTGGRITDEGLGPVRKDILAIPHPFIEEREVPDTLMNAVLAAARRKDSSANAKPTETRLARHFAELRLQSDLSAHGDAKQIVPGPETNEASGKLHVRILRVPLPDVLVVNGQPVGSSWTAAPVLKNIFFTAI